MLHQESFGPLDAPLHRCASSANAMTAIAYRSRPVSTPSMADLDRLLRSAQQRNRAEGLTGVLIYDQGCFFQWLEGPKAGLERVWDSIRRDSRHTDFKILRHGLIPQRLFCGWDMRLARRTRGEIDRTLAAMAAPHELLAKLRIQPSVLAGSAWDQVFAEAVLPQLRAGRAAEGRGRGLRAAAHARAGSAGSRPVRPHDESGTELANVLRAVDPGATTRYVDALVEGGADLDALFQEVFEPAARCLGGLWEDDRCDDFRVTLALGRLQVEVHRLSKILARDGHIAHPVPTALVALQPGEPHGLNAAMIAELLARDGWDVSYLVPRNDNELRHLLHERWFDVLDLSLSAALLRDSRLPSLRSTIRAARAASLNPDLAVIVDGRSFFEHPHAYHDVGADAGCVTCTDAGPVALALACTHAVNDFADAARRDVPRLSVQSRHPNA